MSCRHTVTLSTAVWSDVEVNIRMTDSIMRGQMEVAKEHHLLFRGWVLLCLVPSFTRLRTVSLFWRRIRISRFGSAVMLDSSTLSCSKVVLHISHLCKPISALLGIVEICDVARRDYTVRRWNIPKHKTPYGRSMSPLSRLDRGPVSTLLRF